MSQIGFIIIAIGMQGLLGEHNALAASGTFLHFLNHSLFKLLLFVGAGVVFMNLKELDLNKIRGYGKDKPLLKFIFLMPILGIVRVKDIDEAIDLAVKAEHGNRHTAHMHSKNIDNLSRFAKAVETTIFVKNAPSYAGIGFGGEGHTTFTIAGPTGEGITSARSFTRLRRCVMADHFRII